MMYALLLVASALLGADDQTRIHERGAAPSRHIDGTWQVIYAESGGKPLHPVQGNAWVTIKNNTVSFNADAFYRPGTETERPRAEAGWRLEFGPDQTVRATAVSRTEAVNQSRQNQDQDNDQDRGREQKRDLIQGREKTAPQGAQSGVYILSREYLCLSLRGSGRHGSSPAKETGRIEEPVRETGRTVRPTREATAGHQSGGPSGESFIVILRRTEAEGQPGVNR
jgi:hypothetical protein